MNIGARIKDLRKSLGLTQKELAEKCGYKSLTTINKIELGINSIPLDTIEKLANALQVTPTYLLGWDTPAPADEYSDEEKRLVGAYRVLPEGKRLFLLEMIEKFAAEERGSGHVGNKWNRG